MPAVHVVFTIRCAPAMTSEVVNLFRVGHRFNCFQEVEKLVVDLRQFGFRVRITSSCLVEKCNQMVSLNIIYFFLNSILKKILLLARNNMTC